MPAVVQPFPIALNARALGVRAVPTTPTASPAQLAAAQDTIAKLQAALQTLQANARDSVQRLQANAKTLSDRLVRANALLRSKGLPPQ